MLGFWVHFSIVFELTRCAIFSQFETSGTANNVDGTSTAAHISFFIYPYFLYSGNIVFQLLGEQKSFERYDGMLRITALEYGYEVVPKVKVVKLNALSVKQQDTKCITITFSYSDFQNNQMFFDEQRKKAKAHNEKLRREYENQNATQAPNARRL